MNQITFKKNKVSTAGQIPSMGNPAPNFSLVNEKLEDVSLKDFKGKKKILTINPSFDTSVCTLVAKKLNEIAQKHPEIVILAISKDLPFAQSRFCKAENVKNILFLSMMKSDQFGKDYGLLMTDGPLQGLLARAIFVLDEKDKIIYVEVVSEVTAEPNYSKLMQLF